MVSVPPLSPAGNPPAVPLPDSRSVKHRSYRCDPLPAGEVRLIDGTPADAVVEITKGRRVCRYLVGVTGWTVSEGVISRWQKPDGTVYTLTFAGFDATCDCPACSWESTARADRRHRTRSGSYGCCKLDALAELVVNKLLPDPRERPGDAAVHPGEAADAGPADDLPF